MITSDLRPAAACGWPDPGANPYRGDQADAVMLLTEIPAYERGQLADMVRQGYGARRGKTRVGRSDIDGGRLVNLRSMNSGAGAICRGPVDRSMWPAGRSEAASEYSVGRWSVLVFDSCRNVALADNTEALPPPAPPSREGLRTPARLGLFAPGTAAPLEVPEPGSLALTALAVLLAIRMRGPRR